MPDVMFVAPDLHGGVGRCVAFIADGLPAHGVDASLFLLRARNREYPIDNPKVVKALPVIESPTALRLALPLAFARLLAQIRRDKPAIVCSHGLLCNMLAVAARKILRGPFRHRGVRTQQPGHPLRRLAHAPPEILAGQPDLPPP
ncbi:glycosyltransferase [Achromobacter xylosoxidans]